MPPDPASLATQLAPLVAAYCRRPAVRHELGLAEGTSLEATVLAADALYLTYLVHTPDGRRWVARLSTGSPLGLSSSKQIAYEARALRFLEPFHIAPQLCYVDATLYHLPYGFLVMEYLPGELLNAQNPAHLQQAARLLARLHSIPIPADSAFIRNDRPLSAIVEQAAGFLAAYTASSVAQTEITQLLSTVLRAARASLVDEPRFHPFALVHTDLQAWTWIVAPPRLALPSIPGVLSISSTHPALRLIGWSKPVLDDPTADLCSFLAPTMTRLSPNHSVTAAQQEALLTSYLALRPELDTADLRDRFATRMRFVYLHAFTQCAATLALPSSGSATATNDVTLSVTANYLDPVWMRSLFGDWIEV